MRRAYVSQQGGLGMKTNIYCFSGTGNTIKVAEILKTEIKRLGGEARLADIEKGELLPPADVIVIAYPIYGFNPPLITLDFAKALPDDVVKVYFLKTSGEPLRLNDASSLPIIKVLEKKGYLICGEYHCVMPYNMVFRHTDELAAKMLITAKERVKQAAKEIASGTSRPIRMPLRARFMRAICQIEHKGMALNGRLYKVDMKKCIKCGKCVKNCPRQNIVYENGSFRFKGDCLGCARCAFTCPRNAVSTGLLNFLKVNGEYDFTRDPDKAELPRYCRRSYKRYFEVENIDK